MAKLAKRKYPAAVFKESRKWYTGYEHDVNCYQEKTVDLLDNHEIKKLELQYAGYRRGRTAAHILMKDKDGFQYLMSMSGFDLLLTLTDAPAVKRREIQGYDVVRQTSLIDGAVWYCGSFCQTKQGQNYFIEPVEIK